MTTPRLLVDLTRIKRALAIDEITEKFDYLLTEFIEEASGRFEHDCGQPILKAPVVHDFSGNGRTAYTLPFDPVSDLSKLQCFDIGYGQWSEVPTTAYMLRSGDDGNAIVLCLGYLNRWCRYQATMNVGFENVPPDVRTLIRNEVIKAYLESPAGKKRLGIRKETIEAGTDSDKRIVEYDLSDHEERWDATVARYRRLP